MGTNAGVGMSHHRNPKIAGREAAERALAAARIDRPDFVFMFASVGYEQRALLDAVRVATGGAPLAGGSGGGGIAGGGNHGAELSRAPMALNPHRIRFKKANAPRPQGHFGTPGKDHPPH